MSAEVWKGALARCLPTIACALALGSWSGVQPQPGPELMRVYLGGDELMPAVLDRLHPSYPTTYTTPFNGDIDVETVVGTTGAVIHVRAASPGPAWEAFRDLAVDAARQWRFRPAMLGNGTTLPVLVLLRMTFRAPRGSAPPETSVRLLPPPRVRRKAELPAVTFQNIPAGSGLTLIRNVKPQYTSQAMQRRLQGTATLNILVLPDGTVGEATVAKSVDRQHGLDEQAVIAARYCLYEPAVVDGQPVAAWTTLQFEFRLQGDASIYPTTAVSAASRPGD